MWRAIVMAIGLSLCLLGGECMVVDRMVLAETTGSQATSTSLDGRYYGDSTLTAPSSYSSWDRPRQRVFVPPEWAPWGLLSAGVLTVLYGTAIPRG